MKKYAALLMMIAIVAGLTWAVMLTLRMGLRPATASSAVGPAILHAKEGEEALQRLRRIDQVLTKIDDLRPLVGQVAVAPLAQPAPVALASLNPTPAQSAQGTQQAGKPGSAAAPAVLPAPVISMVYVSTNMQRAVINGKLYGSGDLMLDGARVKTISLNEVVIDYKGKLKVLKVPRSQVSASTLKTVSGK